MKSVRKKIFSLCIVSVMIVAALATVITLQTSTTTPITGGADNDIKLNELATAFNTPKASYNTSNAAFVLGLLDESKADAWYEMLYPKKIYIDKTETLKDAGYYVRLHGKITYSWGYLYAFVTYNSIGSFSQKDSGTNWVSPSNTAFNFDTVFSGYGLDAPSSSSSSTWDHKMEYGTYSGSNNGTAERRYAIRSFGIGNDEWDVTYPLTGNVQNTGTGTYTRHLPGGRTVNNSSTQSFNRLIYQGATGGIGGSTQRRGIDAFTDENDRNVNGGAGTYFGLSANGGYSNSYAGWAYRDAATISIEVYDKTSLNTAISSLTSRYRELSNGGLSITNASAYNTLVSGANTMLRTREVTAADVANKTSELNSFVFEIAAPGATASWTYGSVTAANAVNTVYNGYKSSFMNISVSGETTDENNIFNAGVYNITFTVKDSGKYKFVGNKTSVTTVLTINKANINVGSTANQTSVFTGAQQFFSSPPSSVTTVNNVTPTYEYSSTSDTGPWNSSVSFTDAGTHKVYFKISANNHNDYIGSYNVVINKADISLTLQKINSTFGDAIPGSNGLIDGTVTAAKTGTANGLLSITDLAAIKNKLKEMVTFKVVNGSETLSGDLSNKGSYTVGFDYNDNWGSNVSITFAASTNQSAYIINAKEISVTWANKPSLKYDGAAGKRPDTPAVNADDIITGAPCTLNSVTLKDTGNLTNGEAINAGTYTATVTPANSNYVIRNAEYSFTITPRAITVAISDRTKVYGSANAQDMQRDLNADFASNSGVYAISGDGLVSGHSAGDIFALIISATVPDGGAYINVGESHTIVGTKVDNEISGNYNVTFTGSISGRDGKFTVTEATLTITRGQVAPMPYIGVEQDCSIPTAQIQGDHDAEGRVKGDVELNMAGLSALYTLTDGTGYASEIKIKDVKTDASGNALAYTIYYKIKVKNHKEAVGSYTVTISKAVINVSMDKYTAVYGSAIPDNAQIKANFNVSYTFGTPQFDVSNFLEFYVQDRSIDSLGGEMQIETYGNRAAVGSYTVYHRAKTGVDEPLTNYTFNYTAACNNGAYIIEQKELTVKWAKGASASWKSDSEYVYDNKSPVPAASADVSSGLVEGDTVVPYVDAISQVNVGAVTASARLTDPRNQHNYKIVSGATYDFNIVKRTVIVKIKNMSVLYGSANSSANKNRLGDLTAAQTNWSYGSAVEFIGDHYQNYTLYTPVQSGSGSTYYNVGKYPIIGGVSDRATGAIVNNYEVSFSGDYSETCDGDIKYDQYYGKAGIFEITKATMQWLGRTGLIDYDATDHYYDMAKLRTFVAFPAGGDIEGVIKDTLQIKVTATTRYDTREQANVAAASNNRPPIGSPLYNQDSAGPFREKGYYVYHVYVTAANYRDYIGSSIITVSESSVLITITGNVEVEYGDNVLTSDELFAKLNITAVKGLKEGGVELGLPQAIAKLKTLIEFTVGSGSGSDLSGKHNAIADYSVYVKYLNSEIGENFNIGFENDCNQSVYKVVKRKISVDWNWDEVGVQVYGDHKHPTPVISNLAFEVDDGTLFVETVPPAGVQLVGGHSKYVGTYTVNITGVRTDSFYTIEGVPAANLSNTFRIVPREITVTIKNHSYTYGSAASSVETFKSRLKEVGTSFEIGGAGLVAGDDSADIFSLSVELRNPIDGLNYYPADTYKIVGVVADACKDYTVTFQCEGNTAQAYGQLSIDKANSDISINQLPSRKYNGRDYTPVLGEDAIRLSGDGLSLNHKIYYRLGTVGADGGVEFNGAWAESITVRDASTYSIQVKVTADSHNDSEPKVITLQIEQVNVTIEMDAAEAVQYGTALPDSDWLWNNCNITLIGDDVKESDGTVNNDIKSEFLFRVVGSSDVALSGIVNKGSYRVRHYFADESKNNYVVTYALKGDGTACNAGAYNVKAKVINIEWTKGGTGWDSSYDDASKFMYGYVYNGLLPEITAKAKGLLAQDSGLDVNYVVKVLNRVDRTGRSKNAGEYIATAVLSGDGADNYEISADDTLSYKIVAKKVTVVLKYQSNTYGVKDSDVLPYPSSNGWEVEGDGFIAEDGQVISIRLDAALSQGKNYLDVDTYSIVGECNSANYDVTFKGQDKEGNATVDGHGIYEIEAADLDINRSIYDEAEYNGAALVPDVKAWLTGSNDSGVPYVSLHGDVDWSQATIKYLNAEGNECEAADLAINGTSNNTEISFIVSIPNHNDFRGTIAISVQVAKIVISLNPINVVYGDAELTSEQIFERGSISYSGTELAVDLNTLLQFVKGGNSADKGSYDIGYTLVSGYDSSWFDISFADGCNEQAYIIDAKSVTVVWADSSFVYDGAMHRPEYTIEGLVNGDTLSNIQLSIEGYINAGTHNINVADLGNTNYQVASPSHQFTIAPREIEVVWVGDESLENVIQLRYDGTFQRPYARIQNFATDYDRDRFNNQSWRLGVAGVQKNVGTGYIAVVNAVVNNTNYCLPAGKVLSTEFSIVPRPVTVNWSSNDVFTYNGNMQGASMATLGNLVENEPDPCEFIFDGEAKDAGEHLLRLVGVTNPNYRLPSDIVLSKRFIINPKEVTISWGNTQLTYNGKLQLPTIVAEGAVAGEGNTVFAVEGAAKNVGSYTAVITGIADTNYTIAAGDREKVFTIAKATVEISEYTRPDWISGETPGEEKLPTITNIEGVTATIKYYTDEACTNEYTGSFDNAPAGKYWVQLSVESTANYDGISKVVGSFEIKSGAKIEVALISVVASVVVLAGALAVVLTTGKKKGA